MSVSIGERKFDLDAFRAFVASKPADEFYIASNRSKCALAQFGYPGVGYLESRALGIGDQLYDLIVLGPATFGALASRLDALAKARSTQREEA